MRRGLTGRLPFWPGNGGLGVTLNYQGHCVHEGLEQARQLGGQRDSSSDIVTRTPGSYDPGVFRMGMSHFA